MNKAIYKIENKINHKIYIGQSKDPNKRFAQHCERKVKYTSLTNNAINKYGKDNFSFEIIGWFDDYNEKGKYYIAYYNSLTPNGYNISIGGEEPPHGYGEDNNFAKISNETADKIKKELQNWKIPFKTIVSSNKTTRDIVTHINNGTSWNDDNLQYPIRPKETILNEYRALYIQWLCCSTDMPLNKMGSIVGWGRSIAKMINCGKNHYNSKLKYPIRNNSEYNKKVLSQETCIDYLHFGE